LAQGLVLVLLAAVFYRASVTPIFHVDTWGHWKYGEWIWEHGRLPEREPFSPYSDPNYRLVYQPWLSQLLCYLVYAKLGMEGIALLYALVEVLRVAFYLGAYRRVSGSLGWALLGVCLMEAGRWTFFGVFRPQVLGEVCWAALLFVCARPTLSKTDLVWIALSICLWANLHGGFLLGLLLVGVMLANQVLQRAWERRSLAAAFEDRDVQRWVLALLLSLAAACVNPSGPRLIPEAVTFGNHPAMQDLPEWQPIPPLTTFGGAMLMVSVVLVLLTLHVSPRRFTPAQVMLLLAFGLAAWFSARMLPWWMTVWPFVLLPHWRAILEGQSTKDKVPKDQARKRPLPFRSLVLRTSYFVLLAVALGILLVSDTARWILRRHSRPFQQQFTEETPVLLTANLKSWLASKEGVPLRILPSLPWSDYLLYHLPPSARVYQYTHWHCYRVQQFIDGNYMMRTLDYPNDWRKMVDLYRINAVALEDDPDFPLFAYMLGQQNKSGAEWQVIYQETPAGANRPDKLVAVRRTDPFVETLMQVQALQAQGSLGGLGMIPLASNWSFLTHLPWSWAESRAKVLK
jgi:hypothetical protein